MPSKLIDLARVRFDGLTAAEEKLFTATANGEMAKYGSDVPSEANKSDDRVLRADRIRWLCIDPQAVKYVLGHAGVNICGAYIDGELDLAEATLNFPLGIEFSAVRGGIKLQNARLKSCSFSGTHTGGIRAHGAHFERDVFLQNGFESEGEVNFASATIGGELVCSAAHVSNPAGNALNCEKIKVDGSVFLLNGFESNGMVNFLGATIGGSLSCLAAHFSTADGYALLCNRIKVDGSVFLQNVKSEGEVNFNGATIGGNLDCGAAHFSNPDGHALSAYGIKVDGSVFLWDGFESEGEFNFASATIGGELHCSAAHFSNPDGNALICNRIKVDGSVYLQNGFESKGMVSFLDATIGDSLCCRAAHFSTADGYALLCNRIKVDGTVFLQNGFKSEGEVNFNGATIGGNLDFSAGHFSNPDGYALNCNRIKVDGSVSLGNGFKSEGGVNFLAATIGGSLECNAGHFSNAGDDALSLEGARIRGSVFLSDGFAADGRVEFRNARVEGYFILADVSNPKKMTLGLQSARVGTLRDREKSWPHVVELDGFIYERIDMSAPLSAEARLRWIRRHGNKDYLPQPYEQLAKALGAAGHEVEAKRVLIAKHKDPDRLRSMNRYWRVMNYFYWLFVAYGYNPFKALPWMLGFVLVGWVVFWAGHSAGQFTRITRVETPPTFNALVYSVDTFFPLVDLHQERFRSPNVWYYCVYFWIHIASGWVLTSLFVAGLAGLVRKSPQ